MKTILDNAFSRYLNRLSRGDEVAKLAHQQVSCALEMWKHQDDTYLTPTRHGETRIPNCVKYELPSGYRLITIERESQRIVLFVGKHDDADEWLNNHVGLQPVVNSRGKVHLVTASGSREAAVSARESRLPDFSVRGGTVLEALPGGALDYLSLPQSVCNALRHIQLEGLAADETLWDFLLDLRYASDEQAIATLDVIKHVGNGEVEEAITRAELFAEQATASSDAMEQAIAEGRSTDTVVDIETVSDEELRKIIQSQNYSDWLLYLSPAQTAHVVAKHAGAARVLGVSGSGKTCVAVHRAKELAMRYPGQTILLLVLNESLRTLVHRLLDELCPDRIRSQIRVQRIYDYCMSVIERFGDADKFRARDDDTGETPEIAWDQFTLKKHRKVYNRLVKNLEFKKLDPWGYLLDELVWIRSGIGQTDEEREAYLTIRRDGRGQSVNFPRVHEADDAGAEPRERKKLTTTGFYADTRPQVLQMLAEFEEFMAVGHIRDEDGVALEAYSFADRISEADDLRARCVIVDECQDCSTIQMALIAKIPTEEPDGLLLVGDPAQKVYAKQQNLKQAGVNIIGRSSIFRKNYRNTFEILQAAFPIVERQRDAGAVSEGDILPPEYAQRHGSRPCLIRCKDEGEQRQVLRKLLSQLRAVPDPAVCVGFPAATERMSKKHYSTRDGRYRIREGANVGPQRRGIASRLLPPETKPIDICEFGDSVIDLKGRVTLAEFDEMKGFEFSSVVLVNLDDAHLFPKWIPSDERWRVAFQTYVAMTRARDTLWLLTASETVSVLEGCEEFLDATTGEEFLASLAGVPAS